LSTMKQQAFLIDPTSWSLVSEEEARLKMRVNVDQVGIGSHVDIGGVCVFEENPSRLPGLHCRRKTRRNLQRVREDQ
jgi:hypothetical protein